MNASKKSSTKNRYTLSAKKRPSIRRIGFALNYKLISIFELIIILLLLTLAVILQLLHTSIPNKLSSIYPHEQTIRDYITYSDSIIGLSEQQATGRLKADGMRVAVGERNGKRYAFVAIRIMPPGVITAYLSVNETKSGETSIYNVTFSGESDHFNYIDVLRRDGKAAARDYAQRHNLH